MELLQHGGWVLIAIFALSFFTWFLIVRKWFHLRNETRDGFDWVEPAMTGLSYGDIDSMKTACREHPGLAGRMMLAALDIFESGREFSRKHRREIVGRETAGLKRYLGLVAAAGTVLPLLGLLGTVLGMTKTFGALTQHTFGEANALIAGDISEALITTQAGLVAALPVVLMYGLLSSRIRRNMDECALVMKRLESAVGREDENV